MPDRLRSSYRTEPEAGFSLIEVLVAMFLLGLLSIGLLPALISIIQLSAQNRDQVAATSYANAVISDLRQEFTSRADADNSCGTLVTRMANPRPAPDGSGLSAILSSSGSPPACPSDYPASVAVTVTVRGAASSRTLTNITTEFLVTRA